ncbi:GAF domain-containing protein [Altererythrobacter lutimaris]|uniref:GAF domain-containing protein n=1 Tax=Altererythrobacter lutimaris TaxID=2743979 RepID=A0A850H817_9SPHN|nr:GAF domain-containing protein [Altererythrobacter lutimaris]NVE95414.1 GAF domain-containing protein [Altererythrobacter lutimaris]
MYDFQLDPALPAEERYRDLTEMALALTEGEDDAIANMANIAALIWETVPYLNWAGFYRVTEKDGAHELVLGPFIGRPACIRIAWGSGVCGTAAESGATQRIEDVHAFPGHIACDAASRSELVVPIMRNGEVFAVLDLDSPEPARFKPEDAVGFEVLIDAVSARIGG